MKRIEMPAYFNATHVDLKAYRLIDLDKRQAEFLKTIHLFLWSEEQ